MSGTTRALARFGRVDVPKKTLKQALRSWVIASAAPSFGGIRLNDLSLRSGLLIALVFLAFKVTIFVYVLYSTTQAETGKKFLSLLKNTDGAICIEVPQALNGIYAGDLDGRWATDDRFSQNRSIFQLQFNGKGINNVEYKAAMQRFTLKMAQYGNLSVARSALWSMMTWSSFNILDPETRLEFYSNVDAGVAFNSLAVSAFVASALGSCNGTTQAPLSAIFDNISKQFTLRIPLMRPNASFTQFVSPCPAQLSTTRLNDLFNGIVQSSLGYVDYGFDVRVTSLIMGLNSGAVTTAGLVRVDNEVSEKYGLVGYIDPYYTSPPMPSPVYCLDKTRAFEVYGVALTPQQLNGPEICFLVTSLRYWNLVFFYPVVKQVQWWLAKPDLPWPASSRWPLRGGESFLMFSACQCPTDTLSPMCNQNYFLQGLVYDQQFNHTRTVLMGIGLQNILLAATGVDPIGDYFLNAMRYTLALESSRNSQLIDIPLQSWTDSSGRFWDYSWASSRSIRQLQADEFNKICPDGRCRMILFYMYSYQGQTSMNTPVNRLDLSMRQMSPNKSLKTFNSYLNVNTAVQMCVDTFTQTQAMERLSRAPPVILVQSYYECHLTLQTALMASVGNAAATTGLYVGIIWLVLGAIYAALSKRRAQEDGAGALLLTDVLREDLENAQSALRKEVLYEGLTRLSSELVNVQRALNIEPQSQDYRMRLRKLKALFFELDAEPSLNDLQRIAYCGAELSHRLHLDHAPDDDGDREVDNPLPSMEAFTAGRENSLHRLSQRKSASVGLVEGSKEAFFKPRSTVRLSLASPSKPTDIASSASSGGVRRQSFASEQTNVHKL